MAVDMLGVAMLLKPKPSSTRALGLTALHVGQQRPGGRASERPGYAL